MGNRYRIKIKDLFKNSLEFKKNYLEGLFLVFLFTFFLLFSYGHIEQSISLIKYHNEWGIQNLIDNYNLFHRSFGEFFLQTGQFHEGNTTSGWRTMFYLLPLFLFCDLFGGFSFKLVCFFTVTTSLLALFLFYLWIRNSWGRKAAFFGVLFFGFSAVFQEFSRSGSYGAYSLLLCVAWLLLCFLKNKKENVLYFLFFGILTGFSWYAYSLLRGLTLVAFIRVFWSKIIPKWKTVGLFLLGFLITIIPGVIILLQQTGNNGGPMHLLFVDKENILDEGKNISNTFRILSLNLIVFLKRITGFSQMLEPMVKDRIHAHFINPILFLPMMVGFFSVLKSWRQFRNIFLLLSSVFIFGIAILTSDYGYIEARRSVFYLIPMYCYLGLGAKLILDLVLKIKLLWAKRLILLFFVIIIGNVLVLERSFVHEYILSPKRDLGLLAFSDKLKKLKVGGEMLYLERPERKLPQDKRPLYLFASESNIMRVALVEKGKEPFRITSITPTASAPYLLESLFLTKSPDISEKEFSQWCVRNKLKSSLVFESPVINLPHKTKLEEGLFKFYKINR